MIAKPRYAGVVVGQVYEVRTGTSARMVNIHDNDEEGDPVFKRVRIEVPIHGRLVWDGRDWISEREFAIKMRLKAEIAKQRVCRTILRKG
jgi:hypothetical protein